MIRETSTLLLSCLLAATAQAGTPVIPAAPADESGISYNNLSVGYAYGSADALKNVLGSDVGLSSHGVAAGIEFSPIECLYLAANGSASNLSLDDAPSYEGLAYFTLNLGTGLILPIQNNLHFVTEVGASYAKLSGAEAALGNSDEWGAYVSPHLRFKHNQLETHIGVTYTSNEVASAEWTAFARLVYEVDPEVELYVGVLAGLGQEDNAIDMQNVFGLQAGLRRKF